jgi:general secretion pathway protein D
METFKPTIPVRGRAAILASACLLSPLMAGELAKNASLSSSEVSRRNLAIQEAQELLAQGDKSYYAGRFGDAVEAYSGARSLIPEAPISKELRDAATERLAQASVEQARILSRKGDVAAAKAVVDKVLLPSVAPDNAAALAFRNQLDDPIRTNPALTAEHAKQVDEVRRTLYLAQGAYDLGKFNEAASHYNKVIRIDPNNSAARRGLEEVATAKSNSSQASYDQTRAEMLAQVDQQWELQPPAASELPTLDDRTSSLAGGEEFTVRSKLDQIIIPKIILDQASLDEALELLRLYARDNDTLETDPARKGVNFAVNLGPPESPAAAKIRAARFDLQLFQVPLSQALRYITDITQTSYSTDPFSVIITPAGSSSSELVTRTYRVPPDFISSISSVAKAAESEDPFGEATSQSGLLAKRMGAKEALESQGVAFPDGASATYYPSTNSLRVLNTSANQDFIEQVIEAVTKTEPVMVTVRVTMMRVQQTRLEELGFDWILDNFGFGGSSWIPGASEYNLSGGTQGNGGDLSDIALPAGAVARNPITAGNRSGDSAISGNRVDELLANPSGRQSNARAPGILGVRGSLSNLEVQTLMRGLNQKKGVDMMAKPAVVTRSGQTSSITMVREFIYATEYEPPELPNTVGTTSNNVSPVTPATPTAFETKDVGINLEVLPVVDENKKFVNVTLSPTYSDFDGFVNYGSPINTTIPGLLGPETVAVTDNSILMPIFSKQSVSSSVDVADGATVVVGGLLQDQVQNVEDKTPVLSSIPIVGRLFQSKATQSSSTAIIFLVNVELMDPTGRLYRDR